DPGDGGSAIGAALYLTATNLSHIHRQQPISAYLGKSYDESPVVHSLKKLDSGILRKFTKSDNFRNIQVERIQNESDLLQYVSSSLRSGKIVAWLQGRFENGPRALGNRSILCNPARTDVAMRLSQKVKLRAPFRPYAFSVAADEATNLLNANDPPPSATKWMQVSAAIPVQHHKNVAAALHIDGTSRPQVCSREDNPRFFGLLKTFGATSGVPAILNTSFNESGSPLVSSPAEALMMFLRTDIDILVLNDTAIERRVDA
ncbi:MAG: hypothetical protein JNJ49_00210, partial [Bdellovibrionaceae bacterium]|nr:hypothetical protein [Pseudobdellovibrionaceae bacterium]